MLYNIHFQTMMLFQSFNTKILQKDAGKGDPFLGFILKIVPGIHDPRISEYHIVASSNARY